MTRADTDEAVFGVFDGSTSAAGVVGASIIAGSTRGLVVAAVGLAVAAMVGMGAGQWLSDTIPVGRTRRALVMAAATLAGSVTPAIPFFITSDQGVAVPLAAGLTLACGAVIAELRPGGRGASYAQTFVVLIAASVLAAGAGAVAGGVG